MHKYHQLIQYALRQWQSLSVIFGISIAASAVTALHPWPMKLLVDYALGDSGVPALLSTFLARLSIQPTSFVLVLIAALASFALFTVSSLLDVGLGWSWTVVGQRLVYDLAADLFHRLQRLSPVFHSRYAVGDLLSRLTADTLCLYTLTGSSLISPLPQVVTIVTIGVVAWHLDPTLTLLSLVVAPVLTGSTFYFGNHFRRRTQASREAQSRVLSFVHQTLTSIPIVQAFGTEAHNQRHFRRLAASTVALLKRGTLTTNAYESVSGLTTTLGTALIIYVGGQRVLAGALSVGSLLVFLGYLQAMQSALQNLLNLYVNLKGVEANMDRVVEVMDAKERVVDMEGARPLPTLRSARSPHGHIRFDHVSFGYTQGRSPVLHSVTLDVPPGQTLALVGPTGAGKSTLVSLIPRFFDPWAGRVLFDHTDVRTLQLDSLRQQVSVVLQEPFLLPLSVADNIAYGRPGASRREVIEAAEAANADDFVRHLPAGYDTVLGERGCTLSGGERQRLSIARALLKDAPVLILDEPTAALDAQTEWLLIEALERLMVGRTTVIIAHRLSTIRRASQIAVLRDGRVAEVGTHTELLARGDVYAHLHAVQFARPELVSSRAASA